MKRRVGFSFHGLTPLRTALEQGLKGYAVELAPGGAVVSVQLFVSDGSIVVVRSVQSTLVVGEWEEIDTLQFRQVRMSERSLAVLPLAEVWLRIARIEKIIFETEDFSAECGISLLNQVGDEFVISAGAFAGSLALRAPFVDKDFEPQYDLADCRREELNI
jgi:hypothetical protein